MFTVTRWRGDERIGLLTTSSARDAKDFARQQSERFPDHVLAVERQGFGDPICYARAGALCSGRDLIRELTRQRRALERSAMTTTTVCDRCGMNTDRPIPEPSGVYCPMCFYERMTATDLRAIVERHDVPHASTDKNSLVKALVAWLLDYDQNRVGPTEYKSGAPSDQRELKRLGMAGTSKVLDDEQMIVQAVVNVFGIVDDGNDMIHPGAFIKTLSESSGRVRILDSHSMWSTGDVIGIPREMREVGRDELPPSVLARWPEATGGLLVEMQFRDTERGRNAYDLISMGQLEYSIGIDVLQSDMSRVAPDEKGLLKTTAMDDPKALTDSAGNPLIVRNIRQVRLWDVSPVVWGMNPATATVSVKARAALGAEGLPLADDTHQPTLHEARKRMIEHAALDVPLFAQAFLYCEPTGETDPTGYHLQFADVVDGKLYAIPWLIMKCASDLQEGKWPPGMTVVEAQRAAVTLGRYYDGMDTDPPWGVTPHFDDTAEPRQKKTVSGAADLPLANREREWSSDDAVARVRAWAGGPDKDEIDWGQYRKAFFWYNSDDPENFTSYKLPFADEIDGELYAVPRALFAVAGVLEGARGGVDIPDSDKQSIRRKVTGYYRRMREEFDDENIQAPWETQDAADGPDVQLQKLYGTISKVKQNLADILTTLASIEQSIDGLTSGRTPQAPIPPDETGTGPQSDAAPDREALKERARRILGKDKPA